jgi:hypothetical protein
MRVIKQMTERETSGFRRTVKVPRDAADCAHRNRDLSFNDRFDASDRLIGSPRRCRGIGTIGTSHMVSRARQTHTAI